MENITNFLSRLILFYWKRSKRSFYTLISLLLLCLLAYNSFTTFLAQIPFPAKTQPDPEIFLPEYVSGKTITLSSLPSSPKLPSSLQHSVNEEISLNTRFRLLHKNLKLETSANRTTIYHLKRRRMYKKRALKFLKSEGVVKQFEARVINFFKANSSRSSCELRFFMTWISPVESFGDRVLFSIESLFKSHPNGCLIIASHSMDSRKGTRVLRPFLEKGFKVTSVSPDFNYLFKKTSAQAWYNRLKRGNINPGEISLGQNLSNLLRIGLLYRFGGIYLDTDIIILTNFGELRNVIGAQTVDPATGHWSRLNNAVMIFDKGHPLLLEFIDEFAKTFDGNKWGHNGPYLVSRVVSRLSGNIGYDFTVLPPMAFYPVGWSKIGSLFEGPRSLSHSKWLVGKMRQIRRHSFAVHLWNKQSRQFKVEKGSIIQHLMFSSSVFGNYSSLPVF